jgi:uncharacterized membrane protein (DUF106 family)
MNTMKSTFLNNLNTLVLLLIPVLVVLVDLVVVLVNLVLVGLVVVLREKFQSDFERVNPLY